MPDDSGKSNAPRKRRSKLPLVLGLSLFVIGSGAGFAAVSLGIISEDNIPLMRSESSMVKGSTDPSSLAFLPLDPIIITINPGGQSRLVRFTAQLDVNPQFLSDVEILKPRIIDILNGYLRALELEDLERPGALIEMRSQMLHRVRIVTGDNRVNDLLVMELVIN